MTVLQKEIENILVSVNNQTLSNNFEKKSHEFYHKYDISSICFELESMTRYDIDDILCNTLNWYQYDTIYDSQYN